MQVVINAAAEVNPTHYFDSKSGAILALDHLTLVCFNISHSIVFIFHVNISILTMTMLHICGVSTQKTTEDTSTGSNQDASKEEERVALQSELDTYMTGRFLPENCAAGVFAKDGNLSVSVAGERPNLRNFWSGKWVSNWDVSLAPGEATVTGNIKV